jgi:hypothetical protein
VVITLRNFQTHAYPTNERVMKFDDEAWAEKRTAELYSQFLAENGIALSYKLSADCTTTFA